MAVDILVVTAVIVVDANSVESITNKFDKSYKSVEDRFNKIETDFVYTMTETKMPSKVLYDEAANGLISLMYTMSSGICDQDEETGIINSASYFKSIDTKDDLTVTVDMRARTSDALEALSSDYEITSGLCNMKYSISKAHPVWSSSEESDLAFRPLDPPLETTLYITWNCYQSFTPIAQRFLQLLKESFQ